MILIDIIAQVSHKVLSIWADPSIQFSESSIAPFQMVINSESHVWLVSFSQYLMSLHYVQSTIELTRWKVGIKLQSNAMYKHQFPHAPTKLPISELSTSSQVPQVPLAVIPLLQLVDIHKL